MTTPLKIEVDGHVLKVGLDRPEKLNAFDLEMLRGLAEAYARLEAEPELRALLLYSTSDHFTAGLDLAEVGPAVKAGRRLFPEGAPDPLDLFGPRRTKPVLLAARGWCLTIGVELMLAADIRLAGEDTRFGQIEVKRGIMPFGGATLRFPALTGWGNAMRYLLTGDELDAREALRIGLVQEIAPSDAVNGLGLELAHRVARQAPLAVQATLRSARVAAERGVHAALETLMGEARGLMDTEDAKEGLRSFVERRDAEFTGR